MGRAYYNENDPFAAAWLRNLIAAGHLPPGDVDERSIVDVRGDDLRGYGACHFFAGIGGWPYALRLAGVPDGAHVWTGSCPCQPFSVAGRGAGTADKRHLWPEFHRLIAECRPAIVFGEQVASKDGRLWLAGVRADLEALGYAVGAADLCAAGIGAPHIRQRLYWMADASSARRARTEDTGAGSGDAREGVRGQQPQRSRAAGGLAQSDGGQRDELAGGQGRERDGAATGRQQGDGEPQCSCESGGLADADRAGRSLERIGGVSRVGDASHRNDADGCGQTRGLGDPQHATRARLGRDRGEVVRGQEPVGSGQAVPWANAILISCEDGKWRRIEPGLAPLATGVPGRVGRLRGYGNALCAPLAAEFVMASIASLADEEGTA